VYPREVPDNQVHGRLMELLGLDGIPDEVACIQGARKITDDGLDVVSLRYENSLGESVPGILCAPRQEAQGTLAGVVCLPGTSGSAERLADAHFQPDQHRLVGWARELSRRGFATLSLSVKGCNPRCPDRRQWLEEAKLLAPYGRTQMGVLAEEVLLATRVLAGDARVDPDRIGVTGFSLGGNAAWYAMACGPWIRAAATICGGVGSMHRLIHEGSPERHGPYVFVPHLLRHFDHARIVACCIAPRPFMAVCPTRDQDMPRSGVDELVAAVSPVYEAAGTADRFKVHKPEGKHAFTQEYFEWMVAWLKRFLCRACTSDARICR